MNTRFDAGGVPTKHLGVVLAELSDEIKSLLGKLVGIRDFGPDEWDRAVTQGAEVMH